MGLHTSSGPTPRDGPRPPGRAPPSFLWLASRPERSLSTGLCLERSSYNPAHPDGTSWTAGRFPTRQASGTPTAGGTGQSGAGLPHAQDQGGWGAGPSLGRGPDDQSCGEQ